MVDAPCSRVGHIYRKYSPFGGVREGRLSGKELQESGCRVDGRVRRVHLQEETSLQRPRPWRHIGAGGAAEEVGLQAVQLVHEGGGLRPGEALSARGASGFRVWRVQKPG